MNVLVYGGGAVGLGIASTLLKSNATVSIVGRLSTVEALKHNGIERSGLFGGYAYSGTRMLAVDSLSQINQIEKFDYVLVCTKSFDSAFVARDLSEHHKLFDELSPIILFQNGWGNADYFVEEFGKTRIFNARVITGFKKVNPASVLITVHANPIHIGSLYGENCNHIISLCELIKTGGIGCEVSPDISKELWTKMLYNCSLNGLGAIVGVTYGELAENQQARVIMNRVIDECFAVMNQSHFEAHWDAASDYRTLFYGKLVPKTSGHESSTLQDIRNKKRTEIDSLNGVIVDLGKKFEVSVPYNEMIYHMVKLLESKN
jgi:2-dehydropantoate 2-reductase